MKASALHLSRVFIAGLLLLSANSKAVEPQVNYKQINLSQVTEVGENDCAYKVLTQAYELIGYRVNFIILPAKRALIESNSGHTDGETARITNLETQYPNLVRVPVAICHMNSNLYRLSTNTYLKDKELSEMVIGIVNGSMFVEAEFVEFNTVAVLNNQQLIRMLLKGRIDAIVVSSNTLSSVLPKAQFDLVTQMEEVNPKIPLFHYLHKKHHYLFEKIHKALLTLENSGFIAEAIRNHE